MSLEAAVVSAVVISLSSILVTPFLSGLITFATFVAGRSVSKLEHFADSGTGAIATALMAVLPRLDLTNISNSIVYAEIPSCQHIVLASLYTISYSVVLLSAASLPFTRRHFN